MAVVLFEATTREQERSYEELRSQYLMHHADRKLILFGCGQRGLSFGAWLREREIDFSYTDNSEETWAALINGQPVYPPDDILSSKDYFVVITVNKPAEIRVQLQEAGWISGDDFLEMEDAFAEEIKNAVRNGFTQNVLALGDCFLSSVSRFEAEPSMRVLLEELGAKVLGLPNINMKEYYFLWKLLERKRKIQRVLLLLDISTFSHQFCELPRAQHPDLWKELQDAGQQIEGFTKFLEEEKRREHLQISDLLKTNRKEDLPESTIRRNKRMNTILNYLFSVKPEGTELAYFQRLLDAIACSGASCLAVLLPVNYEEGERLMSGHFAERYEVLRRTVVNAVNARFCPQIQVKDLSFLLPGEDFISIRNLNEGFRSNGRKKIVHKLESFILGD